jgi:signal transduction histidine kinase
MTTFMLSSYQASLHHPAGKENMKIVKHWTGIPFLDSSQITPYHKRVGGGLVFYGIFVLVVFSVILMIMEYQNRYCWFFLMMIWGMILSFFSIAIYLNMFGNYYYNLHIFFSIDYSVFSAINKAIRLPISALNRMINAGMVLYLLAVPLFVYDFTQSSGSGIKRMSLFILLILYNLSFYDPFHAYRIYLNSHISPYAALYIRFISALHLVNRIVSFIYLFYPVKILIRYRAQNHIHFIRQQISLLASCLAVQHILFYGIFFIGPSVMSVNEAITRGFWIFENIYTVYTWFYLIIPATIVGLLLVTILLFNYRLGSLVHIFVDRKIQRNISRMNELLSDILHSEKNLLFSIHILADQAVREEGDQKKMLKTVEKIREISDLSLQRTSGTLDTLRDIHYQFTENNLIAALEEAVAKANLGEDIAVAWDKGQWDSRLTRCRFDYYHINAVLVNLLNNAAEAIRHTGRKNGHVLLEMAVQFQWIFIIIQDNGIGIKKADLKRIFEPYYSGKSGGLHWGLGLTYTYRVVKSHWGQIRVESKWGEGTSVQIILPLTISRKGN